MAISKYNDIMFSICYEYNTIGTSYTEKGKGCYDRDNWNLRDLVSEMQYTLDIWNDPDCIYYQDAHNTWKDADERKYSYRTWINEKNRMKRFIDRYKDDAMQMQAIDNHCSCFD